MASKAFLVVLPDTATIDNRFDDVGVVTVLDATHLPVNWIKDAIKSREEGQKLYDSLGDRQA